MRLTGMSSPTGVLLADNPCSAALAEWLRAYPAKVILALFQEKLGVRIELDTAKRWKAGGWPQGGHLYGMGLLWGREFVDHVFAPVFDDAEADLDSLLDRTQRSLALIRRKVAHETSRSNRLHLAAGAVVASGGDGGRCGGAAVDGGQRLGRVADTARPAAAARGLGKTLAVLLLLAGAVAAPVADMAADMDMVRAVRTARVRAGRGGREWA